MAALGRIAAISAAALAAYAYLSRSRRRHKFAWHSHHTLSNGTAVVVRTAEAHDVPAIFSLIHSLAVVCGEGHEMQVDLPSIREAFARGDFEALVATAADGHVVAMAIVQESFRTFSGMSLYLQDLIVHEAHRGAGLGALLFELVAACALRRGCNRVFWESVVDNHRANAFYADTVRAEAVTNHLNWRIEGTDALATCASRAGVE